MGAAGVLAVLMRLSWDALTDVLDLTAVAALVAMAVGGLWWLGGLVVATMASPHAATLFLGGLVALLASFVLTAVADRVLLD